MVPFVIFEKSILKWQQRKYMGLFTQKRYKQHVEIPRPSAPLGEKLLVYACKYRRIIKRNIQISTDS